MDANVRELHPREVRVNHDAKPERRSRSTTNEPCFCCKRLGGRAGRITVEIGGCTILDENTALCDACARCRFSAAIVAERMTTP